MRNNAYISVPLPLLRSALVIALIIKQPNVIRVIDFHLTPKPTLIMPFYPNGHLKRHLLTDE